MAAAGDAGGDFYGPDLAHVHDAGFGDFARDAGRGLVTMLRDAGIGEGLVVDLGCGSGIAAEVLLAAGYDVFGVDVSSVLLAIARERAPAARFERASAFDADLPACAAVIAVGEVLGYAADPRSGRAALREVFARAHAALPPGGLLVFDLAGPGREPEPRRAWQEGDGWVCLYEASESDDGTELRRRVVTLRREGSRWRRADEEHVLRLHPSDRVLADLEAAGFAAEQLDSYAPGSLGLPGLPVYRAARI